MKIPKKKYYCDSSAKTDEQWKYLLGLVLELSDMVEFNILFRKYKSSIEEEFPNESYKIIDTRIGKIYQIGKIIQIQLSDTVKRYILQKDYTDWKNYFIEDVCFLSKGKEILSTVSHENYIIMPLSEDQRQELNNKGFDFDMEWRG